MTTPSAAPDARAALKARWKAHLAEHPRARIRDVATALGVSELELLETDLGVGVTRLRCDFSPFLNGLESLGRVMALTRNDACVIETHGVYTGVQEMGHAAIVIAPGVDLRIFPQHWAHAYAVVQVGEKRTSRSIQVFDTDGSATHKVYVTSGGDVAAFEAFAARFRHDDQTSSTSVSARPPAAPERPDDDVDRDGLLEGWAALKDTHDFGPLLESFGASRVQALRLAEGRFSRRVATGAGQAALTAAAEQEVSIMAFVGSRGTIQIHTGPVHKTLVMGTWFNVMDPEFNLHLDEARVDSAWVVRKPGERGVAVSLELYDAAGEPIALLFAMRKPEQDHGPAWEAVLDGLS